MEGGWEGKSTYVFYLELITDVLHLFVYVIFFIIVFTNYGLPLHLVSRFLTRMCMLGHTLALHYQLKFEFGKE